MQLTILIPFFNGYETIERLIESISPSLPILIVDDLSDKPLTHQHLGDVDGRKIQIVRPQEKGYFTGAVNVGLQQTHTDVLILNQDAYFMDSSWLEMLKREREKHDMIGEGILGQHPAYPQGYVHGTFLYLSRKLISQVGLMDAENFPLWGSTCEYQLRARRKDFSVYALSKVPGFIHDHHKRGRDDRYGTAITEVIKREPNKFKTFIKTPPTISVVVGTYNHGRYLPSLVHSLIGGPTDLGPTEGQTFQAFELIIVDDGSTDDTPEIMAKYHDPSKGIWYIRHEENKGLPHALNTAVEASHGHYITVLGADDMMSSGRLEVMLKFLEERKGEKIVACDDMLWFRNGAFKQDGKGNNVIWKMPTYSFRNLIDANNMHAGIMYPKQAWVEAQGYNVAMRDGREDWAFNVALGLAGWCGKRINYPGYLYRRDGQNRTLQNTTPEQRKIFAEQIKRLYPQAYDSKRWPVACCGNREVPKIFSKNGDSQMVGNQGFTYIQYTGNNMGVTQWRAPVSNKIYFFGGKRSHKEGYIDARDWEWFDERYDGVKLFKQVPDPNQVTIPEPEPIAEVVPSPVMPTGRVEVEETLFVTQEQPVSYGRAYVLIDPNNFTNMKRLEKHFREMNYTLDDLLEIQQMERDGKNRKGMGKAIQKAIDAVAEAV